MDVRTMRLGSAGFIRRAWAWTLLPIVTLILTAPPVTDAQQVVTNITSSGLNTVINPVNLPNNGTQYNITGGTRPGGGTNLFHSFGDFNVPTNNIANFLNSGSVDLAGNPLAAGLPTNNILGRVTAGNPSVIFGTIQTKGTTGFGNANLFLVNPSGFVFGPNGSVNVGGSVSFTTAQYIRLLDGAFSSANFYANPANDGLANSILAIDPGAFEFLSANPNAYGFLTAPDPIATITVQGSALSVPSGQSISLVGGKVVIKGGAQLSAPNGTIQLATANSPGEFASSPFESLANATKLEPSPNNPVDPASATSFTSFGRVSLALGSSIDVHGTSTVLIKGGQLVLSVNDATLNTSKNSAQSNTISLSPGSSIATANSGTDLGVDVQLTASNVSLNGLNDAVITTQTDGAKRGGNVTLTADRVTLDQFARIVTGSGGEGAGGDVIIQGPKEAGGVATSVVLSGSSQIGSSIFGSGAGGKISITAESLDLSGFSSIISSTNGSASNGEIVVSVHDARLADGSTFASDTAFAGEGVVGGNITVQGLKGKGSNAASLILEDSGSGITASTFGTGKLGDIEVRAETLRMTDGAVIQSGTPLDFASAGAIKIFAGVVDISGGSRILSHAFNLDAGPVTITANQFSLNNSRIETDTSSPTDGHGGDVNLTVGSASLTNGATINSSASNTGVAGNVNILASGSVTMTNGSTITASSTGSGNAGQVVFTTPALTVDDATITTSTSSTGNAGDITANVGTLTLTNAAEIASSSTEAATGAAGSVTIQGLASPADAVTLTDSSLRTSADSTGRGGSIRVDATNVTLNGATISASVKDVNAADVTDGPTSGIGNIALTSSTINMTDSTIAAATAGIRNAGTVSLNAASVNVANGTLTTSTSGTGNAGSIKADVGTLTLTNAAEISSSSTGTMSNAGDAGSVTIKDSGSFTSNGSKVSTSAEKAKGGDILIDAQSVQLSNGTLISANSNAPLLPDGAGNAGNITINSDSNVVMQNSKVTTEASNASGGDITINANAAEMVQLVNSRVSTSVGGSVGVPGASDGGNITIDPQFVILQNSQIIAQANAGAGGAIKIVAGSAFIADPASIVDASSTLGISGPVIIESPVKNVGGQLTPLSQQFSSAAALLAQRCAARVADGKFSTFVVAGREGLPAEPGGFLASPSWTAELLGSSLSGLYPHRPPIPAVTGSFPEYDARPIQLAKYGDACR